MKLKLLIVILMFVSEASFSQDETEEIKTVSEEACLCLEDIEFGMEKTALHEEIKSCIESSNLAFQLKNSLMKIKTDSLAASKLIMETDTAPDVNITIYTDKNYKEIETYLLRNCEKMKSLMASDESQNENSISDKEKAIEHYSKGQDFYAKKKFKEAIGEYEKAVKADKTFAFALDNLALSHRQLGDYKNAIKYYNKSLKLDPNGRVPLMNKPVAYQLMGEFDKAIEGYEDFIEIYPTDPEGFYGMGRIYYDKGDYENALDNMMKAFNMYNEISSPYARDAETIIVLFYGEMKEKGQLELFHRMAKKHDINIEE